MGMNQLWAILIIASLIMMTLSHPVLMITVGLGVFLWNKYPQIGYKLRLLWKKLTTKKTPPQNRRPRL